MDILDEIIALMNSLTDEQTQYVKYIMFFVLGLIGNKISPRLETIKKIIKSMAKIINSEETPKEEKKIEVEGEKIETPKAPVKKAKKQSKKK